MLIAAPLLLAGCSFSVPMGSDDAPATTGSLAQPVKVQQPLPPTLAYSDAAKIGQTAAEALAALDNGAEGEWVNNATGSSGTVEAGGGSASHDCDPFATTVTSIGGVHRYSGEICKARDGRSVVRIDQPAALPSA